MAYSLEQARTDLKRITPWITSTVSLEPLDGLYDGSNRVFHLPIIPASSDDTLTIYDNQGDTINSANYSVIDYDHGAIRFVASATPSSPRYATYTAQSISNTNLLSIAKAGFDDMEGRYQRHWTTISSGGYNYISSSPLVVTDPVCGLYLFSTSRANKLLFGVL